VCERDRERVAVKVSIEKGNGVVIYVGAPAVRLVLLISSKRGLPERRQQLSVVFVIEKVEVSNSDRTFEDTSSSPLN
jgi:hypothetical protein